MSIFRKASELDKLPSALNEALFENHDIVIADEFASLIKEASSADNRSIYENRLKSFQENISKSYEFEKTGPAKYAELEGGIRRVGHGQRFNDEHSELFGAEKIRSINYDNNKYAESLLENGFSIWEPEFDSLKQEFDNSQKEANALFDKRTAAEKKALLHKNWEASQVNQIRKSNILPHRGLGFNRLGNEQPIHHGNLNSVNDFYAEAQDSIRSLIKESNNERKTKITRKGVDPNERRDAWQNKEAVEARTLSALENASFLSSFADGFLVNE